MIKTVVILGALAPMLPSACAHTVVVSDYCQSYTIIKPARTDTAETLRQVARENAKWRSVCQQSKP